MSVDTFLTWLMGTLSAAASGVTLEQWMRSKWFRPHAPYEAEERAILAACWQLGSVRIAFTAIRELLVRVNLKNGVHVTVRPERLHRRAFVANNVSDDFDRHKEYYNDFRHHLHRLSAEMAKVPPGTFVDDSVAAWATEQLNGIRTAAIKLEQADLPLDEAITLVQTELDAVHGRVAYSMREHFGTDLIGVPASTAQYPEWPGSAASSGIGSIVSAPSGPPQGAGGSVTNDPPGGTIRDGVTDPFQ
jgi:hypothetical protein